MQGLACLSSSQPGKAGQSWVSVPETLLRAWFSTRATLRGGEGPEL